MKTLEFTEQAGDDRVVRLNIPVDTPGQAYHVVVHIELQKSGRAKQSEYLSEKFVQETAGQWVGEFPQDSEGENEERLPL